MCKLIVYILDKAVWLLIATVITTQALQLAGILDTPKSAGAIEYQQGAFESLPDHHPEGVSRWKRDTPDTAERSQFIDMLFNRKKQRKSGWTKAIENAMFYVGLVNKIPIKTLTAVNNLIQNSRPAIRKLRDFAAKRFERTTKAPETDTNTIQKRSYPVYIRPVGENNNN